MSILLSWLTLSFGMWLNAQIVPGFHVKGVRGALLVGAIFGLLHWAVGWLLFGIIALATLGIGLLLAFLTWWLVSAILLKVTDALLESLTIRNFKTALIGAAILSLLSAARELILR